MQARTLGAAALSIVIASVAGAQSADQFNAYGALLGTPIGALPPLMTSTMTGALQRGPQLAVRYGYLKRIVEDVGGGFVDTEEINANNAAASVILPLGIGTTVSLTAGGFFPGCTDCQSHLMLSLGGDTRLGAHALGPDSYSSVFTLGVNGELGFGNADHDRLLGLSVGLPMSLVQRGPGMRVVPFIVPQIGYGSQYIDTGSGTQTFSGSRFMIGGGVGVYNPASTVSVTGGFQYVHLTKSMAVFGLGIHFGG